MPRSRAEADSFRSRAASLLRPLSKRTSLISASGEKRPETSPDDFPPTLRSPPPSSEKTLTSPVVNTVAEDKDKQRFTRTLPPWVQSATEDDDDLDPTKHLLPRHPSLVRPSQHNFMPAPKTGAHAGRVYDHARENIPAFPSEPASVSASKWRAFAVSSAEPRCEGDHIVDEEWMQEHMPDLEGPWAPGLHQDEATNLWLSPTAGMSRLSRIQRTVLKSPFVPLVVRLFVLTFSAVALGLSSWIWNRSKRIYQIETPGTDGSVQYADCAQQSATILAICFNSVALVYIFYITYDEYTSKPLGLRSARAKLRLIFLDLIFIVFDAATVSLAFSTLVDPRWACYGAEFVSSQTCPRDVYICGRQKALVVILLIALVAWLTTFAISTIRLMDRVVQGSRLQ